MPPVVIDLRSAEDCAMWCVGAVQAVAEGGLVAFPTETVYGLAARAERGGGGPAVGGQGPSGRQTADAGH